MIAQRATEEDDDDEIPAEPDKENISSQSGSGSWVSLLFSLNIQVKKLTHYVSYYKKNKVKTTQKRDEKINSISDIFSEYNCLTQTHYRKISTNFHLL